MKRFYVRGMAFTTKGIFAFQDRNIKSLKLKYKRADLNYTLHYKKLKRKGSIKCFNELLMTKDELCVDYITVGILERGDN